MSGMCATIPPPQNDALRTRLILLLGYTGIAHFMSPMWRPPEADSIAAESAPLCSIFVICEASIVDCWIFFSITSSQFLAGVKFHAVQKTIYVGVSTFCVESFFPPTTGSHRCFHFFSKSQRGGHHRCEITKICLVHALYATASALAAPCSCGIFTRATRSRSGFRTPSHRTASTI